jgi:hypothetical protein
MRFMILRKADAKTEAGAMPDETLLAAMAQYTAAMTEAGILLGGVGLHPSARGTRVRFAGGKPTVTDGPFAEAKELIAGVALIEVKSREEAIQWVERWPPLDGDGNVEIEIRQVKEAADFGGEDTPELRDMEGRLRAHIAAGR